MKEFEIALENLIAGKNLSRAEAGELISSIMEGKLTPSQIAAFLTALRCKGESVDEITGAAEAMRSHAMQVKSKREGILDTCGTGGDKSGTFNISTTAACIVAGAGAPVAKHGNRSASSQCGSIDLLEKLGVNVNLDPAKIGACLDTVGIGILFARVVHPAMKHAAPIRGELKIRTIFNFLGPLTNPATPDFQLVGISNVKFIETYAECLQKLGIKRAWVVAGEDGLDEITLTGSSTILDVRPDSIEKRKIVPEDAGLSRCTREDLLGGSVEDNARMTLAILDGTDRGTRRDAALFNAGAALLVAGKADSLQAGVNLAVESVDSGKANAVLDQLIQFTNEC